MTATSGSSNAGSSTSPPPPSGPPGGQSMRRRLRDWFGGLSETGKVGVVVALIGVVGPALGFLGVIVGPLITAAVSDGKNAEGSDKPSPSASAPRDPSQGAGTDNGGAESGASTSPSASVQESASPSPSNPKYTVVYENQDMQLGMGDGAGWLDFDKPASRLLSEDEWNRLSEDAGSRSRPVEPDLAYINQDWGLLSVLRGRNAAQLDSPAKSGKDCAVDANLGGFSEARVSDGAVKPGDAFCFITDQGSVVSAEVLRIRGEGLHRTPIEFTVTMWKPE